MQSQAAVQLACEPSSCCVQEFPIVVDGGQEPLPEEPQLVEEEFDLSDIMGEQLEAQVGTQEDRLRQLEEQVLPFPSLPLP